MTYKETVLFIGKCLTINHEEHNRILIEEKLKSEDVDWDNVVRVSTAQYVFPALYCNLKRANFLSYLPDDLVEYMKHITDLNRERNIEIIEQAKEINTLLIENNITPIFLKGTGNLLEGLYEDIGERMVGDIDFIIAKKDYKNTIKIILNNGYSTIKEITIEKPFQKHYPRLTSKNKIAAVEIHNKILKDPHEKILDISKINHNILIQNNLSFLSNKNKVLNAILPKILNDNLYSSNKISLRTIYDVFLLSLKTKNKLEIQDNKINKKLNNVLYITNYILNKNNQTHLYENKHAIKYKDNYFKKRSLFKEKISNFIYINNRRLRIFKYSFTSKDYRKFFFKRIFQLDFYKILFNIKPNP